MLKRLRSQASEPVDLMPQRIIARPGPSIRRAVTMAFDGDIDDFDGYDVACLRTQGGIAALMHPTANRVTTHRGRGRII